MERAPNGGQKAEKPGGAVGLSTPRCQCGGSFRVGGTAPSMEYPTSGGYATERAIAPASGDELHVWAKPGGGPVVPTAVYCRKTAAFEFDHERRVLEQRRPTNAFPLVPHQRHRDFGRKGLMITTPSTCWPWFMSSEYNSRHPSARAAATIALSQYDKP